MMPSKLRVMASFIYILCIGLAVWPVAAIIYISTEIAAAMMFSTVFIPVAGFLANICNVVSVVLLVVDNIQAAKERDANEVNLRQELWAC